MSETRVEVPGDPDGHVGDGTPVGRSDAVRTSTRVTIGRLDDVDARRGRLETAKSDGD